MSIINRIEMILNEQLKVTAFNTLAGVFGDKDEFGVDAAISILRDKIKEEMETIVAIASKSAMGNVNDVRKRFMNPLMKALDTLEGDPLNKGKYKKAEKLFDSFVKKIRGLI
jgi:intergrase/recombinase